MWGFFVKDFIQYLASHSSYLLCLWSLFIRLFLHVVKLHTQCDVQEGKEPCPLPAQVAESRPPPNEKVE